MIDLEALRKSYSEQITQLQRKLSNVDELIEDGKRLGVTNSTNVAPEPDVANGTQRLDKTEEPKYSKMTLTPAVQDSLRHVPSNGLFTGSEVRRYLLRNGFRPPKHFISAVNHVLDRFEKKNLLAVRKDEKGVRIYRLNNETNQS